MSELTALLAEKQKLTDKLKELETVSEGLENEKIRNRVRQLNIYQSKLSTEEKNMRQRFSVLQETLKNVTDEINQLSSDSRDTILEAIKKQRWYFIKNKPKVLLDCNTGYLWANLNYFPYAKSGNSIYNNRQEAEQAIRDFDGDGYTHWEMPSLDDLRYMIADKTFPFKRGRDYEILGYHLWYCGDGSTVNMDYSDKPQSDYHDWGYLIPYERSLSDTSYKNDVAWGNRVYTEKERLQRTLDLFVQNGLQPIFEDEAVTELFYKVYVEKPKVLSQLQEVQGKIDSLQKNIPLSSTFDYRDLLKDYNSAAIDASVIQYYKALQRWAGELLEKLDEYEAEKEDTIQNFNVLSLTLSQKYEADPNLTEAENDLMEKRQRFFQQQFSLDMNRVKDKILSIKDQADDLEARLDAVDEKEDSLTGLAELEREARPSFSFIAENTAKIIKEALLKIEYFESHKEQVQQAIAIWQSWTEDYRVFKSTHRQALQHLCQENDIEEAIWGTWYADWQRLRLHIEEKVQPLVAWALRGAAQDVKAEMADALLGQLASYKDAVDHFFLKERKGIYQKYAFVPGGELQEKFEAENELYKRTREFQNQVSDLIFSCQNSEDRILIFKWAFPLWNLSIDEVLRFVADKNLSAISADILRDFAALKSKRYAAFLNDAKAYSQAQKERDNQYNNLIFKMRKNLMPAQGK
ncbi:hypothetical protein [uncultured Megasphaera sp.]|uniref:hypothetical protein n=1 Tax=uncultured Megasphaera sp. TaxID=165188 RepID=UPI00260D2AD8|nr:hypothetical protein [uncultured Megasphaera sp.]